MRYAIVVLIAVGVVYLTIWPHELGHSAVAYHYGCKANWWQTDVSWFLWSSWSGAVDYDCLEKRGGWALGLTDFGGIAVNLVLLALAPVVGRWWRGKRQAPGSDWWFIFSFFWALANYAEAFSYLVLNTLWLKSDMLTVVTESEISRWIWLAGSLCLAVVIARCLRKPAQRAADRIAASAGGARMWRRIFVLYVAMISLAMAVARITLT